MCTPNRLHMQEKFKGSVKNSKRPQIPLCFLSSHSLPYFLSLYLLLFKTRPLLQQPAHYNFQQHFFPLISLHLFLRKPHTRLIDWASGSKQETSVPVSFTKLGPSVSYSAFHLLPIRREITCTIFIILSKPFEDFLLHNFAQCRRLPKCSLKHIYFHIFTYKIHVYTYTCWLDNLLGTNI